MKLQALRSRNRTRFQPWLRSQPFLPAGNCVLALRRDHGLRVSFFAVVNSVTSVHSARVLGMPMRPCRAHALVLDYREGQRCRGSPDRGQSPVFGCGAAWRRPVPLTSGVATPPATALEVGTATLTAEYV